MLKDVFAVFRISSIISGTVYALIIAVVLTIILSFIFYFTSLPEIYLNNLSLVALIISVFFGGKFAAKLAGAKGLLQGLSVGFFFLIVITVCTALFKPEQISLLAIAKKSLYIILAGGLGGVLGIPSR